jgi:hypothetical protein
MKNLKKLLFASSRLVFVKENPKPGVSKEESVVKSVDLGEFVTGQSIPAENPKGTTKDELKELKAESPKPEAAPAEEPSGSMAPAEEPVKEETPKPEEAPVEEPVVEEPSGSMAPAEEVPAEEPAVKEDPIPGTIEKVEVDEPVPTEKAKKAPAPKVEEEEEVVEEAKEELPKLPEEVLDFELSKYAESTGETAALVETLKKLVETDEDGAISIDLKGTADRTKFKLDETSKAVKRVDLVKEDWDPVDAGKWKDDFEFAMSALDLKPLLKDLPAEEWDAFDNARATEGLEAIWHLNLDAQQTVMNHCLAYLRADKLKKELVTALGSADGVEFNITTEWLDKKDKRYAGVTGEIKGYEKKEEEPVVEEDEVSAVDPADAAAAAAAIKKGAGWFSKVFGGGKKEKAEAPAEEKVESLPEEVSDANEMSFELPQNIPGESGGAESVEEPEAPAPAEEPAEETEAPAEEEPAAETSLEYTPTYVISLEDVNNWASESPLYAQLESDLVDPEDAGRAAPGVAMGAELYLGNLETLKGNYRSLIFPSQEEAKAAFNEELDAMHSEYSTTREEYISLVKNADEEVAEPAVEEPAETPASFEEAAKSGFELGGAPEPEVEKVDPTQIPGQPIEDEEE